MVKWKVYSHFRVQCRDDRGSRASLAVSLSFFRKGPPRRFGEVDDSVRQIFVVVYMVCM
jgi:hypothetical protein